MDHMTAVPGAPVGGVLNRLTRWFALSVAVIFVLTGSAKLYSACGSASILSRPDPIFAIPFRILMLFVGLAEIAVAFIYVKTNNVKLTIDLTRWLSTGFLIYRFALWWIDWRIPCPCLGHVTDALHISPLAVDIMMKTILGYLLIVTYGLMILLFRKRSIQMNALSN